MKSLADFERDATRLRETGLRTIYLAARNVATRKSARDEQRALATLLFSGPSTAEQLAEDLGISKNLAERILRVLGAVIEERASGRFALRADTDTLAVVLQLLRGTLGLDPIRVLRRRIRSSEIGGPHMSLPDLTSLLTWQVALFLWWSLALRWYFIVFAVTVRAPWQSVAVPRVSTMRFSSTMRSGSRLSKSRRLLMPLCSSSRSWFFPSSWFRFLPLRKRPVSRWFFSGS